jgi:hypothetical protein
MVGRAAMIISGITRIIRTENQGFIKRKTDGLRLNLIIIVVKWGLLQPQVIVIKLNYVYYFQYIVGLLLKTTYDGPDEADTKAIYACATSKAGPHGANAGAEAGMFRIDGRSSIVQGYVKAIAVGAEGKKQEKFVRYFIYSYQCLAGVSYSKISGELQATLAEVN